jgi:hypothetical protein
LPFGGEKCWPPGVVLDEPDDAGFEAESVSHPYRLRLTYAILKTPA